MVLIIKICGKQKPTKDVSRVRSGSRYRRASESGSVLLYSQKQPW